LSRRFVSLSKNPSTAICQVAEAGVTWMFQFHLKVGVVVDLVAFSA
jgi:hypothetical protein